MHSGDIEYALAQHLNTRQNLIVPNISWGLGFSYEIDLLVVTPNNYAWEIEIKISKKDLKADIKKKHGHYNIKIKRLYFAVPLQLKEDALLLIPERAGLFIVYDSGRVELIKPPTINLNAQPLTTKEIDHLYKLSMMRMWSFKRKLYYLQRNKI